MKPIITKFNDKTGDFETTIPVPFTLKDGIEYVNMMVTDVPKYEDTKDYNVFDLIRENQELKLELSGYRQAVLNNKEMLGLKEQKQKEVIDKADKWIRDYMNKWDRNDEVWYALNDLLILLDEVK